MEEAERIAAKLAAASPLGLQGGMVVARVSVQQGQAGITVDMPPEAWVRLAHEIPEILSTGYYYLVIDPKTFNLIVAQLVAVERQPLLEAQRAPTTFVPLEKPHSMVVLSNVSPLKLHLEPMLAVHLDEEARARLVKAGDPGEAAAVLEKLQPVAAVAPPDPGSPVVIPHPDVLAALLAHSEGVPVGALAVMDRVYVAGGRAIPVRLTWSVLVKHVLVTGTTGSGKTSLVKNIMYAALNMDGELVAAVLDAGGDYVSAGLPGYIPAGLVDADTARVLEVYGIDAKPGSPVFGRYVASLVAIPCTSSNGRCSPDRAAEHYAERLREAVATMYSRHGCSAEASRARLDGEDTVYAVDVKVTCEGETAKATLYIAPRLLVLRSVEEIAQIDPYMTERAREALPYIARNLKARTIEDLLKRLENPANAEKDLGVHRQTLAHLASRLRILKSMGVIRVGGGEAPSLSYGELVEAAGRRRVRAIVLDLAYAGEAVGGGAASPTAVRVLLGYQFLRTMLAYAERTAGHRALLVVDEAHLFFPRGGGEYERMLSAAVERLARLGRSRGIAIVFSTHRESDLSPLIATLANTKIYLRTDRKTAEELPLPREYRARLPYYADHAAVMASYAVRGGYIGVVGAPAAVGHRTT
ncbi:ATP-binding protein [Hyperthermus butylicus]|uniref:ATPase n=1 Tax=Hyperthermus butylicus (strain DSM 5456 / JCM 9403 / PLM1-5) TaxID=415426 RepID=A2BKJ9_HYPBU|nr:ATP-binding protein [Hyperthermus butylicus]ABM80510.1 putative ATPase [Hyperthermus butylicus DSM 5456]